MWLCISGAFLSIVHKDCAADELLVRARRPGDIEKLFPAAVVTKTIGNDYLFRAVVKRTDVAEAMTGLVDDLNYPNFKNTVRDNKLHNAYNKVWHVMADLQPVPPYSSQAPKRRPRTSGGRQ